MEITVRIREMPHRITPITISAMRIAIRVGMVTSVPPAASPREQELA
jgi:hypothetical protein